MGTFQPDPPKSARLMIPGPSELHPADLSVLAEQTTPHYGQWWSGFFKGLLEDIAELLDAETAYILPGSGTAGLEAAIANLFSRADRVIVPDTGYFATRLAEIAAALGLRVTLLPQPLQAPIDPVALDPHLRGAQGVLLVHVDSTTGIRQPIAEIARRARAAGVTVVVDAIASVGGEDVRLRTSGIDAVVTASQKGLAAPPGLAIVALDERGLEESERHRPRSWYFDLGRWREARVEDPWEPHPVTMPTATVRALAASISRIRAAGIGPWVAQRHTLAADLRARLREVGFLLVAPEVHAASLVTTIRSDEPDQLARRAAEHQIMIGRGLPPLSDAVRIGLLGATATQDFVSRVVNALTNNAPTRHGAPRAVH